MPAQRVLSRERIVRVALELIEARGLPAFSMRSLARELGVDVAAAYHHFRSRQDLLDHVVEHLLVQVPVPSSYDGPWHDVLRSAFTAYRRVALAHPHAALLMIRGPLRTPAALERPRAAIAVLVQGGFPAQDARLLVRALLAFTDGLLLHELGGTAGSSDLAETTFTYGLNALLAGAGTAVHT